LAHYVAGSHEHFVTVGVGAQRRSDDVSTLQQKHLLTHLVPEERRQAIISCMAVQK